MTTAPLKITTEQWQSLQDGQVAAVCLGQSSTSRGESRPSLVFPGAFNPLHQGHRRMAEVAADLCGLKIEFEISMLNVDKPPLQLAEIQFRAAQFSSPESLWLTRGPTFLEKSQLFPGGTFVVGVDTILRVADSQYYTDADDCSTAIREIAQQGCRFLVFGRQTADGFQTLGNLNLPASLRQICDEVPANRFRLDITSTELREDIH